MLAALLLVTLVVASLACAGATTRAIGRAPGEAAVVFGIGMCLAPAALGLAAILLGVSGVEAASSAFLLPGFFLALAFAMPLAMPRFRELRMGAGSSAIAVLGLLACASPLIMPLIENDALEYAAAADILNRTSEIGVFPMRQPDPVSGLYAPALHPPAFVAALAWATNAAPEAGFAGQRLFAAWSLAGLLTVTAALGAQAGVGVLAAALILATPFLLGTAMALGIDLFRMAAFAATLAVLALTLVRPAWRRSVTAGVIAGIGMWTHSLGVYALPLGCVALSLGLPREARNGAVMAYAGSAILVGGGWYLRNYWLMGAAISDSWSVVEMHALRYSADLAARRGLDDLLGIVTNGLLRPWTEPAIYGATFWLALLALRPAAMSREAAALRLTCLSAVAGYVVLSITLLALGSDLAVKNPRYWLTLVPCAALLGALGLRNFWRIEGGGRASIAGSLALLLVWSSGQNVVRAIGLASLSLALSGDETGFLLQPRIAGGPLLAGLAQENDGRVLAFRPPEIVKLAKRVVLDHSDPELLGIHTTNAAAAFEALRSRNVRLAMIPDYSPVTLGFSSLGDMLADPRFAEPVAAHRGTRQYRVRTSPADVTCAPVALSPPQATRANRGFGDILAVVFGAPHLRAFGRGAETVDAGRSFSWSWRHSGALTIPLARPLHGRFVVTIGLSGKGVIAMDAVLGGPEKKAVRLLDRLIDDPPREMRAQWSASAGDPVIAIRLTPLAPRNGRAEIAAIALCAVGPP